MKYLLALSISVFLLVSYGFSQVNFTGYLVDEDNAKIKDVMVNLYKGNDKISADRWSKKFEYNLDLETYYTLELVKDGFIPKRIAISTFEGDKGAEPFMFVMELIAQKEGHEDDDADFPSALIEYKKEEGSFNFDVDYSKNIKKEKKKKITYEKKD